MIKRVDYFSGILITALITVCITAVSSESAYMNPEELSRQSQFYGTMSQDQAMKIIEKSAENKYKNNAIITEKKFFMDVPKNIPYGHPGKKTVTKFTWDSVTRITPSYSSIVLSYEGIVFMRKVDKKLKLYPEPYTMPDLALALLVMVDNPKVAAASRTKPKVKKAETPPADNAYIPVSQKPETSDTIPSAVTEPPPTVQEPDIPPQPPVMIIKKNPDPESSTAHEDVMPSKEDLKARLKYLKGLYDEGLITKEQFEEKQSEILDTL